MDPDAIIATLIAVAVIHTSLCAPSDVKKRWLEALFRRE